MVKFYNDGVVQAVTFAYLIYTGEFLVVLYSIILCMRC